MFKHSVQDSEQLAHTSGEGYFLGLSCGAEALVESTDNGVMASVATRVAI